MSRTYTQPGDRLTYSNGTGSDIAAGDVVQTGDIIGIAEVDIADGEDGTIVIAGVHEVDKTTGTAWVQGDSLDWDASAGKFHKGVTPATGDVTLCGVAALAAASAAATGYILLTPGAGTLN